MLTFSVAGFPISPAPQQVAPSERSFQKAAEMSLELLLLPAGAPIMVGVQPGLDLLFKASQKFEGLSVSPAFASLEEQR